MSIKTEILNAIDTLGISGADVNIHSSMGSFSPKSRDIPKILTDSFLEKGCTLLVPTFSYMHEVMPTKAYMPKQNGAGDYSYFFNQKYPDIAPFTPECKIMSTKDMGVFSEYILNRSESIRGNHPANSLTAIGKNAETLIREQTATDVYSPFKRLCDSDGYVVLIGVGLDTATIIHYAENLSGRNLFVRWVKDTNGDTIPTRQGGCSDGFPNLDDAVSAIETKITVSGSVWRVFKARELVEICAKEIGENPMITHCDNENCERCNDAILGGPYYE